MIVRSSRAKVGHRQAPIKAQRPATQLGVFAFRGRRTLLIKSPDRHARETYSLSVLRRLEAESIHILREVAAEFERPVMMYSVGKDSSVLLRLAQKAFHPGRIPFPLLHIDTAYKFPEMYAFRDRVCAELGVELRVLRNEAALAADANPWDLGTVKCCGFLKTQGLLDALKAGNYDAVIGGARREEERSRAKERIYSFRDPHGQWDPKNQRPELWNLYNGRIHPGESIRVFPLSNWTELDIWRYVAQEEHRGRAAVLRRGARRRPPRRPAASGRREDAPACPASGPSACWCAIARWAAIPAPARSRPPRARCTTSSRSSRKRGSRSA